MPSTYRSYPQSYTSPDTQLSFPARPYQVGGTTPQIGGAQPYGTPSVEQDAQAHLTSVDTDYQKLHDSMRRDNGPKVGTQTLQVIESGRLQQIDFSIDKNGTLTKVVAGKSQTVADVKVLYCDELGIVRDSSGNETGKVAIPKSWAAELTDPKHAGVFLHSSQSEALMYYKKVGAGYAAGQAYMDAGMSLVSGERVVFRIGKPPLAKTSYTTRDGQSLVTSVGITGSGESKNYSATPLAQRERGAVPSGEATKLNDKLEKISQLLERSKEQMQTTTEKRDSSGKVIQKYQMRLEYLTHRDSSTGQLQRNAFGVNTDGSLLMFVGNQGTEEERTKNCGWRNLDKAGFRHLFVQKDFTVVDKYGKHVGVIDVTDLDPEQLKLKDAAENSFTGVFLSKNARIVLNDGSVTTFNAETLTLGKERAVIQLGSPPDVDAPPPMEPNFERYSFDMELARAGGLAKLDPKTKQALKSGIGGVEYFMTADGSMRICVDSRAYDADAQAQRNIRAKEIMQELKNRQGMTGEEFLPPELELTPVEQLEDELEQLKLATEEAKASIRISLERRTHVLGNSVDALTGSPRFHAIWTLDPSKPISLEEFRSRWPGFLEKDSLGVPKAGVENREL